MILENLPLILKWWAIFFAIGIIFLPFSALIFKRFFDKGYIFSKILGVSILSYTIFALSDIHLLKFTTINIFYILIFFVLLSIFISKINNLKLKSLPLRFFIFEELIFLLAIIFWTTIRGFQPDIHGLEKFMDFGFINSILKTKYLPPVDIWYPPYAINYYYFGHLSTAVITKLSYINSKFSFNLMIATIFAFCFNASFSLGANLIYLLKINNKNLLTRKIKLLMFITGLFCAILITFGGNLHTIYAFFKPYTVDNPIPFWQLAFSPKTFPNQYWYPDATRFIYHTIHEFPIYSFVVSDLHGHVLDLPNVLLMLAIFLTIFIDIKSDGKNQLKIKSLLLVGFFISILYMTNAWDSIIYFLIFSVLIFNFSKEKILKKIIFLLLTFISFLIFSLPFSVFFRPLEIANQIGLICSPQFLINIGHIGPFIFEPNRCEHSYWWELLTLYGFFLFNFLGFIYFINKKYKNAIDDFVIFLSLMSFVLILIPEFFYLKDIYTTYYRANTMFKLVYQAFIILSISTGYMITRIILNFKAYKIINKLLTVVFIYIEIILLSLVFIYPFFAIGGYYNNLQIFHGLDGEKYLQNLYPYDYKAIDWINTNIKDQKIMLEAQGDSYTDYERISTNTGLPTVLGWTVHEWLWRGNYSILIPRMNDIKTIYETNNLSLADNLIKKYSIKYVYVGGLEKQKYTYLNENKFNKLGIIIYQNPGVKIFTINK